MKYHDLSYEDAIETIKLKYIDKNGLITMKNGDRGDTANKEGIYHFLRIKKEGISFELETSLSLTEPSLRVSKGTYVRHPNGFGTYPDNSPVQEYVADPKRFSRDQQEPLKLALSLLEPLRPRLNDMLINKYKRLGKYQNKDFTGPQELASDIRCYKYLAIALYPLLTVLDFFGILVNSVIAVVRRKIDLDNTSNDLVLSLFHSQAFDVCPTIFSFLGRLIYKTTNPLQALKSYHRPETGAPPLCCLWEPELKRIGLI